jgi:lysophospholipase L1-like esterase
MDTWAAATLPASVRLEFVGDAEAVAIAYRTTTDDLGYRAAGAGTTFSLWRSGRCLDEQPAVSGQGTVRLVAGGDVLAPAVVYLPEGMKPVVQSLRPEGGAIEPAPRGPRWLAYGDSVAEGWAASSPALAWPAVAARAYRLEVFNLGYAGAARGEIVSAEQLASLPADVISVSHGTNCWTRVPHSAGMMGEATRAFLEVLRQGHPHTPVVVASPVVRPDAEDAPNRLGATLAGLRAALEAAVRERIDGGDTRLTLLPGLELLGARDLADGIHPGDGGHAVLAAAVGLAVAAAVRGRPREEAVT